jgi:hypothetical protein
MLRYSIIKLDRAGFAARELHEVGCAAACRAQGTTNMLCQRHWPRVLAVVLHAMPLFFGMPSAAQAEDDATAWNMTRNGGFFELDRASISSATLRAEHRVWQPSAKSRDVPFRSAVRRRTNTATTRKTA